MLGTPLLTKPFWSEVTAGHTVSPHIVSFFFGVLHIYDTDVSHLAVPCTERTFSLSLSLWSAFLRDPERSKDISGHYLGRGWRDTAQRYQYLLDGLTSFSIRVKARQR